MANGKTIAYAVQRGNTVYAYNEKNVPVVTLSVNANIYASDGLTGYTGSTVSVRRGNNIYTYNASGHQVGMTSAGQATLKNKPVPPTRKSTPVPRPSPVLKPTPAPRPAAPAPAAAPTSWWPAPAPAAPVVPSRRTKIQPLIETEEEIDTAHLGVEDDPGTDDDVQISEMAEAIPDAVRVFILILERRRKRWKILAITFMILFSLPLLLIILALTVGK